jgi:hypothetical protein
MWQESVFCVAIVWYRKYIFSVAKIHTTLGCKIRGCAIISCTTTSCTRISCTTIGCVKKLFIDTFTKKY